MPAISIRTVAAVSLCLAACGAPGPADCPAPMSGPSGPWSNAYGGALGDKATAVATTPGGELFVGGGTRSFGADGEDVWILKLGRSGERLWEERFEADGTESVEALAALADGGAAVVSRVSVSSGLGRRSALQVARLDCAGDVAWAKNLEVDEGIAFAHAIRASADGGLLLVGEVAIVREPSTDCLAVKLSAAGNLEWQRAYGRAVGDEGCRAIATLPGGGYVLAGEYERLDSPRHWSDVWLVGIGPRGDVQWERTYGERDVWERRPSVREAGDGTFLVSAMRGEDAQLLAIDVAGATVWQKSYRAARGLALSDLWVAPDGSPTIVGTIRPGDDDLDDDLDDVWAMRLGPLGDPVWSRRYGRDTVDQGAGVAGFDDSRVVLAGTLAWGSPEDADEVWVLHPDADGRVGSQGADWPVTMTRMNVAPEDTAVRVSTPPIGVSGATVRVRRTQAGVRPVP